MGEGAGASSHPDPQCTDRLPRGLHLPVLRASSDTVQLLPLEQTREKELWLEASVRSLVGASPASTGSCF